MSEPGLTQRLARVRARVEGACRRAGRDPAEVTLVGVAKRKPASLVADAVAAGLGHVGESFAQEARDKLPEVLRHLAERALAAPRWHFVGQLQRNKVRLVAPLFDVVESVDRISLAEELDRRAAALGRTIEVLLQVNTSGEAQKGGASPEAVPALLAQTSLLGALRVTGLMTVPAADPDPERARESFGRLRRLRDDLCATPEGHTLTQLSMGMSADFEVAIEEGATLVRVGTAIFGPRDAPAP
jgi:hypothetical protein